MVPEDIAHHRVSGDEVVFFLVSGTWYLVPGTWYMVPEDIAHHRVSGDEVVVFFPGRINSWVLNDLARPRMICVIFFHCTP